MNRTTHPFRYAAVKRERAPRAPHARTPFTLDLATWLARLSGNRSLPAWLEEQRQAAD